MVMDGTLPSEFVVSRAARERYQFEGTLSAGGANTVAVLPALRTLAHRVNQSRKVELVPDSSVGAGHLQAIGLIGEMMHAVVEQYRLQMSPSAMQGALAWLDERVGQHAVDATLGTFADRFPPVAVYRGELTVEEYVQGHTAGLAHRLVVLEDLLVLWLANQNPAFSSYRELFDDADITTDTAYAQVADGLLDYFETQPAFGPRDQGLVDMLRGPAIAVPESIPGQVEYIRDHWGYLLGARILRLLRGLDVMREDTKVAPPGPGPSRVYEFSALSQDAEQFSPDRDWMPSLVLIAKNAYVWLDQLSKWYDQPVQRLDQIPDRELDALARRGFTGLWLIGLWERSSASRRIKQMCGSPDAVASAYSLMDYEISPSLGGIESFQDLQARAWQRGIRLSADMVPNHVGIDSRWVVEHPNWFISLDRSPFPAYSFRGPDLSQDDRVGIYLEDHYYDRSDAAVVFKRVDRWTGSELYVYHGNDGTSMPWNDTAQLDYIRPEVREAVIQTILHVARMFPIIRFDAAMTLTKQHFQRLWYPMPGTGGDIPSRAEHGLSRGEFDSRMPDEFWREVVDRIAEEMPDTLLLAEAFWLLEGYFVRTLGMHRVYNSAFMHMLRDEDNAKYRSVIKNTLEFDPQVLKRYVSFMNNPDEETAVNQFGKGDKYFGICTLLATLPGLPMFGHGQIEGLAEKYGMEYQRAYWDETPDDNLVERHEQEISPLLHRRQLFAEVDDFLLYDFFTPQGIVNEDVFAYSNRASDQQALIVYHNRYADTQGSIRTSAAYAVKDRSGQEDGEGATRLERRSLGDGLGLVDDERTFTLLRDQVTGLEFIRNNRRLFREGLHLDLGAYQRHVFLDFRQVYDDGSRQYGRLAQHLAGAGVRSIQEALRELTLRPVHHRFRALVNGAIWRRLTDCADTPASGSSSSLGTGCPGLLREVEDNAAELLREIVRFGNEPAAVPGATSPEVIAREIRQELEAAFGLVALLSGQTAIPIPSELARVMDTTGSGFQDSRAAMGILLGWIFVHGLGKLVGDNAWAQISGNWIDELLLGGIITRALQDLGLDTRATDHALLTVRVLTRHQGWMRMAAAGRGGAYRPLESLLADVEVLRLIQVNTHQGVQWFNKEAYEQMLWWMLVTAMITGVAESGEGEVWTVHIPAQATDIVETLQRAAAASEYRLDNLLRAAQHLS